MAKTKKMKAEEFKESLRLGMIDNFKRDGHLAPVLFILKSGNPDVVVIPRHMLENKEAKSHLAQTIKRIAEIDDVEAIGIILEAYARSGKNDEMSKLLLNGNLTLSEIKDKDDAIVMIFSTPEEEEMIGYSVDIAKKAVLGRFPQMKGLDAGGLFGNFFELRK